MFSTKRIHTGELSLFYAEGPNNGPPILFLHGLSRWWRDFEPIMRDLADDWHVFASDFRGHGESGRAPEPDGYLLADHVRDVTSLIADRISDDEPIVLTGYSMGGLVAIGVAAAFPERMRGLFLIEPALSLHTGGFREHPLAAVIGFAHDVLRTSPSLDAIVDASRTVNPDMDEASLRQLATELSYLDPAVLDLNLLDRFTDGSDVDAMLENLRCPITVLHGDAHLGSVVREEDLLWMRHHAPEVNVVHIRDTGHGTLIDEPGMVLPLIREFLKSL